MISSIFRRNKFLSASVDFRFIRKDITKYRISGKISLATELALNYDSPAAHILAEREIL